MATKTGASYPKELTLLKSGASVTIRLLQPEDGPELLGFFSRIPEEERLYLKEDVTSPKVIEGWVTGLDFTRVLPLIALVNGRIVADGTLHRNALGSRRYVGEIRIVVDPAYRGQGLGSMIMRELHEFAYENGLDRLVFELVESKQDNAISVARKLGFDKVATLPNFVRDLDGQVYNMVILQLPTAVWPDWWDR